MSTLSLAIVAGILLCAAIALGFGGAPERWGGAIVFVWVSAATICHLLFGSPSFHSVDPVEAALDGSELIAVGWLALCANRLWTLWAAAAQLICVTGYIVMLIDQGGMRRVYWAMNQLPQYVQYVALLIGTAGYVRRKRRNALERKTPAV